MLDRLNDQPPDALLALIAAFAADEREGKIDLGVGVYRTNEGKTPVFDAVKQAEKRLWDDQVSKSYLGPEGDIGFVHALMPIIFGSNATMGGRIEGLQTPGGTGAVRLAIALAGRAGVHKVHLGAPTWPNHQPIIADVGLESAVFDHVGTHGGADAERVLQIINDAQAGEAVLLHACCHNPTGIDFTAEQWDAIAQAFANSPALPILDMAYQGLGLGLEEDAAGLRKVLAQAPNALIAYSCDKNFGVYRDRVGAFYVKAAEPGLVTPAISNAAALARANWSMPPDHGGATVRIVLRDDELSNIWQAELASMRERLQSVRAALADADDQVPAIDLSVLRDQHGLFAMLPVDKTQVDRLRERHAVYMAGSGRINIAGLTEENTPRFIEALADVTG